MLHLNVGQAGAQLGALVAAFTGPPTADGFGCVFVDSEPKVVKPLATDGAAGRIAWLPPSGVVYDHNGRGNNWAWGYTNVASRLGHAGGGGGGGGGGVVDSGGGSGGGIGGGGGGFGAPSAALGTRDLGCAAGRASRTLLDRALGSLRKHVSAGGGGGVSARTSGRGGYGANASWFGWVWMMAPCRRPRVVQRPFFTACKASSGSSSCSPHAHHPTPPHPPHPTPPSG